MLLRCSRPERIIQALSPRAPVRTSFPNEALTSSVVIRPQEKILTDAIGHFCKLNHKIDAKYQLKLWNMSVNKSTVHSQILITTNLTSIRTSVYV